MTSQVKWLVRDSYMPCYGFCPNEESWKFEMERAGFSLEPYPNVDAHCSFFHRSNEVTDFCLVTISDRLDSNPDPVEIAGLMFHEAEHVMQFALRWCGEKDPGDEQRAYGVQLIGQQLLWAYRDTRNPAALRPTEARKPRASGNRQKQRPVSDQS